MSPISPALSRRLTERHGAGGQGYLAAPVFGRPQAAEAKQLWIVVAGPAGGVERCRPLLDAMAPGTIVVGEDPVKATAAQLAGKLLIAAATASMRQPGARARQRRVAPGERLGV